MQQLTELLGVVAWPIVVVFVLLLFRPALRELLSRDDVSLSGPAGITISARRAASELVNASESKRAGADAGPAGHMSVTDAADQAHEVTAFVRRLGRSPVCSGSTTGRATTASNAGRSRTWASSVDLSTSTEDAQQKLRHGSYDVVVSDMARPEHPRAGYELLDSMRRRGDITPLVIYSSSNAPEHYDEAVRKGAIGSTARPQELVDMILRALRNARPRTRWWRSER